MITFAHSRSQRGVSLVEAIVAMAVMAFGMLGMVGLQATLRTNADLSRQRAEAVRVAQTTIESRRSFSVLASTPGRRAFDDIVTQPAAVVAGIAGDNTVYTLTETVTDLANPRRKTLVVEVQWRDRTDADQNVRLSTLLTATAPALAGAVVTSADGSPAQLRNGRDRRIPRVAVDLGNGTSGFKPPQPPEGNVVWVFNNVTGILVICETTATGSTSLNSGNIRNCGAQTYGFVSGNARFAYSSAPTAAIAENPTDPALNLDLALVAPPDPPPAASCFDDSPTSSAVTGQTSVAYYCAVSLGGGRLWSGTLVVEPRGFDGGPPWTIAASGSGAFKVCRYTPTANDAPSNSDHPRTYDKVKDIDVLTNQNFLVISAEDSCPDDSPVDASTGNFVNSNTRQHQPALP